jgi:BTB/POZ domain-containing protein KCTD9
MNKVELKLNLIYKAKRDGFTPGDFHSRCDNKGPTICVIKSEHGKTFGGFTNLSWNMNH